jgi:uncharacterized protein YjeT (DUF2065 family)
MTTDSMGMRERPGGVTFVVVLAYLVSIFTIIDGFFVVIGADEVKNQFKSGASKNELIWAGIVMMAVGVIGVLLTGALSRGQPRRAHPVHDLDRLPDRWWAQRHDQLPGEERLVGVVPFVLGIVVLYLLFNEKAHDYFAKE